MSIIKVCGGEQSLSSDFVWFYVLKSDCQGGPIYDAQNFEKPDECGVCGGNSDTCKDCTGKIGGSKFILASIVKRFKVLYVSV